MTKYDKYDIVVGLEVHAQLKTNTKIFAPDATVFGAEPNSQTSYITLGHPGTLPRTNHKAVTYAVKMGLATNCHIQKVNRFDRKNYFYPDLPKGYQITQFNLPICVNGKVHITTEQGTKAIGITQIHLEEDAGKSIHDIDPSFSCIDLNRAGVPLIEIVSEPDLRSSDEAYAYLIKIKKLLTFLDICDGNMEEGSMRCDANVSVRLKGTTQYGERTEVKNMNSLRNVKKAIEFEAKRQIDLLENGQQINRETRSFDASNDTTFALRSKELAHDYRYFPEPDLPPVVLSDEDIATIKADMPPLAHQLFELFTQKMGLSNYDAGVLTDTKEIAYYYQNACQYTTQYKALSNWITGPIKAHIKQHNTTMTHFELSPKKLSELVALVAQGKISFAKAAQLLLPELIKKPTANVEQLAQQMNLIMDNNQQDIDTFIQQAIDKYPDKVAEYKRSNKKRQKGLLGLFMGELMKISKGKANPKTATAILIKKLNDY